MGVAWVIFTPLQVIQMHNQCEKLLTYIKEENWETRNEDHEMRWLPFTGPNFHHKHCICRELYHMLLLKTILA